MILDEVVGWYQRKIGTYDKQQWEKSVEQKILDGFNKVKYNKTAKLKTQLIDVDLVRGSTFPKAKPKQSLFTVVRLAVLRYFFLPAYGQWWIKQTSPSIFALLLSLYITQMINLAIYNFNYHKCGHYLSNFQNNTSPGFINETCSKQQSPEKCINCTASISDFVIPMVLSLLLSLIHSQIVATNIVNGNQVKRKQFSKLCHNDTQSSDRPKIRRRKKNKFRSYDDPQDNRKSFTISSNVDKIEVKNDIDSKFSRELCENVNKLSKTRIIQRQKITRFKRDNVYFYKDNVAVSDISDEQIVQEFIDELIQNIAVSPEQVGNCCSEYSNKHCWKTENVEMIENTTMNSLNERKTTILSAIQKSGNSYVSKLPKPKLVDESTEESDEENGIMETGCNSGSLNKNVTYNEFTTSAAEWLGVTTNSEDCSCLDLDDATNFKHCQATDEDERDFDSMPTKILNARNSSDKISCTVWDDREFKKAQMSVLEIASCIIDRVETMPKTHDYIYVGICFSVALTLIPPICRLCEATVILSGNDSFNLINFPMVLWKTASFSIFLLCKLSFGQNQWEQAYLIISFIQRLFLTTILFIIFAAAEKTFKQRFLYAKLFSHLTSFRRAQKSNLPHFRLNKVRNIKAWLSVRSYLKKRGPQRSVDVIVSTAFLVTLLLLAYLSVQWLQDSTHLQSTLSLEALMWSTSIGVFLLRYMTLGNKIQQKYRCISVLITEQINLYLQIEQKPHKKDELMVANSVLKLAADLLKELESPFKISGLSANPYLFTTIKVVILSALSGVLSEMLGFKLKLHKIKIK